MGQLVFQATLGGQVNLVGPNTASTFNINVPAVAGNMVTTGDTGTVSSTMLASSLSLTTPNINVATATTINGLTVGKGAGSVATNTAVGASALAANTTGLQNTAIGNQAEYTNTTGIANTGVGYQALYTNSTGNQNTAVGRLAFYTSTGDSNTGVGHLAGYLTSTGTANVAVGDQALRNNTTASNNTAVGYQAGYSNTTGTSLTYLGYQTGRQNSTGVSNTSIGYQASYFTTTGSYNTSVGQETLLYNTTASENTAVGYQAGYTGTTAAGRTLIGNNAGYFATGGQNTFVGNYSGYYVTSGAKNTIIGTYSGNQGGLDIRTASNYIVLSDGDGTPQIYNDGATTTFGIGGTSSTYTGGLFLNGADAGNRAAYITFKSNGTNICYLGIKRGIQGGSAGAANFLYAGNDPSYGVYLNGSTATSWTSASDERLKENLVEITDAAAKVSSLRAVIGNYTLDAEKTRKAFLIAQDVQAVLPEAVTSSVQSKDDPTEYLGVAYTEVIPLLVAAIKELKAEIDQLKGN